MYKGAENWMKTVKSCSRAFKKIRIRTKKMKTSAADKRIRERIKLVICGKDKEARVLDVQIATTKNQNKDKLKHSGLKSTHTVTVPHVCQQCGSKRKICFPRNHSHYHQLK